MTARHRGEIRQASEAYLAALADLAAARPDDIGAVMAFRKAARAIADPVNESHPQRDCLPDDRSRALGEAKIDIIVPIHNALEDVRACLASLRASKGLRLGQVWLVDDASDRKTASWLATQQNGAFRYLRLDQNVGFTKAVDAGLARSQSELVVILNSDTLVSAGWLDALARPFASRARIALTGPLSNAAAWQSLGRVTDGHGLYATNLLPVGIDPAVMTTFLEEQIGTKFVDLPILHGFCVMLARDAYDAIGGFDLDGFGRGYGETQDLSLRLCKDGYRLGVVTDAFVQHERSASYSDAARKALSGHARHVLYRKHGALEYLRAEAACIDNPDLAHIRAAAAGWFARDGLDIPFLAADSARPTEFAEIAWRSARHRSGRRAGKSVIGLPRSGGVELVSLKWSSKPSLRPSDDHRIQNVLAEPPKAEAASQGTLSLAANWIATLGSLEDITAGWRHRRDTARDDGIAPRLGSKTLAAAIRKVCPAGHLPTVMLSLSHDNYLTNRGGVQFCVQQESATAKKRRVAYLNLHPSQPLPRLAHVEEDPDTDVDLVLDGTLIGRSAMSEVIKATKVLVGAGACVDVVVHHLLGYNPEQVTSLVQASCKPCWFWLHDFFLLCPGFTLLRNDLTYCGAPPASSNACQLCLYGEERRSHLKRIQAFAAAVDLRLISPSDFMTRHFMAMQLMPSVQITTVPHMEVLTYDLPATSQKVVDQAVPPTIAFLGNPAYHKGWQVFRRLSQDPHALAQGIRFIHLGSENMAAPGIGWQSVLASADDPGAMIRAVAENSVDFVLHWANWPETFSFTTLEALAAGALVITTPGSGNVAATMQGIEPMLVFDDFKSLLLALREGRLDTIAKELRLRRTSSSRTIHRSDMTFSAMDKAGLP